MVKLVISQTGLQFYAKADLGNQRLKFEGGFQLPCNCLHYHELVVKIENKKVVEAYLAQDQNILVFPNAAPELWPHHADCPLHLKLVSLEPVKSEPVVNLGNEKSVHFTPEQHFDNGFSQQVTAQPEIQLLTGQLISASGVIQEKNRYKCPDLKHKNQYNGQTVEFRVEGKKVTFVRLKSSGEVIFELKSEESIVRTDTSEHQKPGLTSDFLRPTKVTEPVTSSMKYSVEVARTQLVNLNHQANIPRHQEAHAPYNFVPLNDQFIPADQQKPVMEFFKAGHFTGYIDLKITTKTPLFIGNGKNERFYSIGDFPVIPGSSFRGLVRNAIKIVAHGKFEDFNDSRLYFRSMADRCKNIKDKYTYLLNSGERGGYKMKAGLLYKKGYDYWIDPNFKHDRINAFDAEQIFSKSTDIIYQHRDPNNKQQFKACKSNKGYLVISGRIPKKTKQWMIQGNDQKDPHLCIPQESINNYIEDIRRQAIDLIHVLTQKNAVPVFYTDWIDAHGQQQIAFGHTAMFRIPFFKTIGEHIPEHIKQGTQEDLANAMFGNTDRFVGRLQFEDAICSQPYSSATEPAAYSRPMLEPKPTTFPHYLVQDNLNQFPNHLKHYNSVTAIRGYKLYWHKKPNWKAESQNPTNFNPMKIQPVKADMCFQGKIYFENLSSVELGALLFILDLPVGYMHKLGGRQALGLGSIQIEPVLYLSDLKQRYGDFFAEWQGLASSPKEVPEQLKKDFETYILRHLDSSKNSLWELPRMQEYKTLLNFNLGIQNDAKTQFMELNRFKDRKVLPLPRQVMNLKI